MDKFIVTWIFMDRKTDWKLGKMAAYIQEARGINKDIRTTLAKRIMPRIREIAGDDSIKVDDFIKNVQPLQPRTFPVVIYGENHPELENPLLRELGLSVAVKPSGDGAGILTALILLAEETHANWRLKDCGSLLEHLNLFS